MHTEKEWRFKKLIISKAFLLKIAIGNPWGDGARFPINFCLAGVTPVRF